MRINSHLFLTRCGARRGRTAGSCTMGVNGARCSGTAESAAWWAARCGPAPCALPGQSRPSRLRGNHSGPPAAAARAPVAATAAGAVAGAVPGSRGRAAGSGVGGPISARAAPAGQAAARCSRAGAAGGARRCSAHTRTDASSPQVTTWNGSMGAQATAVTSRACPTSVTGLARGRSTCAAARGVPLSAAACTPWHARTRAQVQQCAEQRLERQWGFGRQETPWL